MILATCLLGPGSDLTVGDAIRSAADCVDGFVFIESGGGGEALRAAYDSASKPAHTAHYDWVGDCYGPARQFALDEARRVGATHAVTLDPDERLSLPGNFRAMLEAYPSVDVWILADRDTGYFKERVIRTDCKAFWHGLVCEFLDGRDVAGAKLDGHFWELPKDEGAERRRWERGVTACQRMIDEGDDCYRWRRHMGSCLMGLGRQAEALQSYEAALPQALNADETAWMRYLICEQYVLAGRPGEARELAAKALGDHAGFIPEFGWILSYTDYKADRLQNASRWAQLVLSTPADTTRIGFRGQNCKPGAKQILADVHRPRVDDSFSAEDFAYRQASFAENYTQLAAALCSTLDPVSHFDLGAGQGLLVGAMLERGVPSIGIELEKRAETLCPQPAREHIVFGASILDRAEHVRTELASCVEVLEHVPAEAADAHVEAICACSYRWIYFSAAAPGQPGKGHVNCQPKKYWRSKFEAQGFRFAEAETAALVEQIRDMQPCEWLPKNAMIFRKEGTP